MNRIIAKIGAWIVIITVILFAIFMLIPFDVGSYFVCLLLSIGYVIMSAGFVFESDSKYKVAAIAGIAFAIIYAVLIMLVYFSQLTTVRLETLNAQSIQILDYSRSGLMFNYDLLGYGMMALSTFFLGLTIKGDTKADKWLKILMMIHGLFFFSCLIIPMTGIFSSPNEEARIGGVIALECWCVFFLPIGILSLVHFDKHISE